MMQNPPISDSFSSRLDQTAKETEILLDRLLATTPSEGEIVRPHRLIDSMRYGSLGGGKRFRPFIVAESAALFGVSSSRALMAGAALECVHGYSLIHDDLPAMDDDDLRRGRPTVHKAFDEATAILAGDGLLTFAFDILSRPETHPDPAVRVCLINLLARAAGVGGMAGGQMLDLEAEGRFSKGEAQMLTQADVKTLQSMKTGALIRYASLAGAILGGASDEKYQALERYGRAVGEAFQIADDLLDIEGNSAIVGKATQKDETAGKATMAGVLGLVGAKARLEMLVEEAKEALAPFGANASTLVTAARFVAYRNR